MKKRILKQARVAHNQRHQLLEAFLRVAEKQHKPSCNTCTKSHCCYQAVTVSMFEAVLLADWIQQNERWDILSNLQQQADAQTESLSKYGKYTPNNVIEIQGTMASEWFARQIPCPFLDNGKCLVYNIRPIACSSYLVVSLPENCAPPSGGYVGKIDASNVFVYGFLIDAFFLNQLGVGRAPFTTFYMGPMVDIAMRALEGGVDVLKKYIAVRDLEGGMDVLKKYLQQLYAKSEVTIERQSTRERDEQRPREHRRPDTADSNPQSVGKLEEPSNTSG